MSEPHTDATAPTAFDFSVTTLGGEHLELSTYRGDVLLIVNTASQCGFTPQYKGLEELHRSYADQGLRVLGFPCNQFGHQEPGDAETITTFCERNYGVTFPMFAKIDVNGPHAHPLYQWLRSQAPGSAKLWGAGKIRWNFTKFLVSRDGAVIDRFAPTTTPKKLRGPIEAALNT